MVNCDCRLEKPIKVQDIPLNCPRVWDLLARGLTKGVFQLESPLGKTWCRKLKPECIEHLSALGALLRPGCLKAFDENGISMTEHYCRRKNKEEESTELHKELTSILEPTYNVMVYQEQAMQIAQKVAGFNLQDADELRKAMGKKLADVMAKVKVKFLEGCSKAGILTKVESETIFDYIEKSQRYSFCHSHALSYAITGYISGYIKAHYPLQFFCKWLKFALDKQDPLQEIAELVGEAKLLDIEVLPPDLRSRQAGFYTDGKSIIFGLGDIKGIGNAQLNKLLASTQPGRVYTWAELLMEVLPNVSSATVANLINAGALDYLGWTRQKLLAEYRAYGELTKGEQQWVNKRLQAGESLAQAIGSAALTKKEGGAAHNKSRSDILKSLYELLQNPASPYADVVQEVCANEQKLLGISLTHYPILAYDTSNVDTTVKEYLSGKGGKMILACEITGLREAIVKNGKSAGSSMAFLKLEDQTASCEAVVFPDVYNSPFRNCLYEGNLVIIEGERSNKDSMIVKKCWTLS